MKSDHFARMKQSNLLLYFARFIQSIKDKLVFIQFSVIYVILDNLTYVIHDHNVWFIDPVKDLTANFIFLSNILWCLGQGNHEELGL